MKGSFHISALWVKAPVLKREAYVLSTCYKRSKDIVDLECVIKRYMWLTQVCSQLARRFFGVASCWPYTNTVTFLFARRMIGQLFPSADSLRKYAGNPQTQVDALRRVGTDAARIIQNDIPTTHVHAAKSFCFL